MMDTDTDRDTDIVLQKIKSNGATLPLSKLVTFVVISNNFLTLKKAVTSSCTGSVTVKNL